MNKRFDKLDTKVEELKAELEVRLDRFAAEVSQDINAIKEDCQREITALRQQIETVDGKTIDAMARRANAADLIISGVPLMNSECVADHFINICKALGYAPGKEPAAHVRRLKNKPLPDGSFCLILVQFSYTDQRDEFFSSYLRHGHRNLTLRSLGFESDNRVYINENLTTDARKIKSVALQMRKNGRLHSVFSKSGVIFIKATADRDPVAITTIS